MSTVRTLLATTVFLSPRGFKEFLRREDGEMAPTTWAPDVMHAVVTLKEGEQC